MLLNNYHRTSNEHEPSSLVFDNVKRKCESQETYGNSLPKDQAYISLPSFVKAFRIPAFEGSNPSLVGLVEHPCFLSSDPIANV